MLRVRRVLTAVTVGVAILAATVLVQAGNANAESNGGVRVMPLGDSITDGITVPGAYRTGLWQKFVSGGYTVDFVGSLSNGPSSLGDHDHEGHSGWRIDQVDANIVAWLRTYNPRTVLLHLGTNDIIQNVASGAPTRLATLIDHITTTVPDAEVFVATIITVSWSDANVRAFNAQLPGIVQTRAAAGKHVHLVNMYSALTSSDLLSDGVHPNAGGYTKMANAWFTAMQSVPGSLSPVGSSPSGSTPSRSSASPSSVSPSSSASPSRSSASPTRSASSSSGSGVGGCTARYAVTGQWQGGFQGEVTVAASGATVSGWTVTWTFANGQTISSAWNATVTSSGSSVTANNVGYNGSLAPGATTAFGFLASWTGTNSVPAVTCTAR